MKACKLSIILLLLLISCISIPTVSAETFEKTYVDEIQNTHRYTMQKYDDLTSSGTVKNIYLHNPVENYKGLKFLSVYSDGLIWYKDGELKSFVTPISIYNHPAELQVTINKNILNGFSSSFTVIIFEEENISDLPTGVYIPITFEDGEHTYTNTYSRYYTGSYYSHPNPGLTVSTTTNDILTTVSFGDSGVYLSGGDYQVYTKTTWENKINCEYGIEFSSITLDRLGYYSRLNIYNLDGELIITDYSSDSYNTNIFSEELNFSIISTANNVFSELLQVVDTDDDTDETVSVLASVLSTADDALIGGATLNFNSTAHNVSQTLTSGYGLYTLYPGVEYTVSASADNYQEELSTNPTIIFGGDSRYDYYLKPVYGVENGTVQLNFYVSTANTAGSGYLKVPNALITLNSASTLITNDAGFAYATLNRSGSISYTITKSGYKTYSRSFTPNWETWSSDTIEEYVTLLAEGAAIGDITPTPTPDTRTSDQKAESAFNILFDNLESIVQLAVLVLIISLIGMIAGGGKKR